MKDLWQPIQFDRGMLLKYDRPGPRSTSYPTAPHFEDGFGHAEYVRLLERSRAVAYPEFPVALGVLFAEERPTYDGAVNEQQAASVKKSGKGSLQKLLNSGSTWEI